MADDEEPSLAGSGGDDVSGGTSVSGVGGEALRAENDDVGLRPVHEQGARLGWGKDARETGVADAADNDGTGQSEGPDE